MQKKKYRVYELVKEFKKSDKEVMDALKKNHIEVTSRLSGVDEGAKTVLAKEFEASKKPAKTSADAYRKVRSAGQTD